MEGKTLASMRDFFYVLTHYREIIGQIDEVRKIADEIEKDFRESEEKMACFITRIRTMNTNEEVKIIIYNN